MDKRKGIGSYQMTSKKHLKNPVLIHDKKKCKPLRTLEIEENMIIINDS